MQTPGRIAILAVGVVILAAFALKPFLNWFFSTYTVTNRRLITRHGILTRTGRDIPLMRINDVSYEHGLIDRILGCGTLHIESAGERGQVVLPGPEGRPGDGILADEEPPDHMRRRAAPKQQPQPGPDDGQTLFSSDDNDR